jgi:hypothetical protein
MSVGGYLTNPTAFTYVLTAAVQFLRTIWGGWAVCVETDRDFFLTR